MNERDIAQSDTVRDETPVEREDDPRAQDVRQSDVRQSAEGEDAGFLPAGRMDGLRGEWDDVQAGFVDDPRSAVQRAEQLVSDLVNELTQTFARERQTLEGQWGQGRQADTETLRVTLQRYRSFFNRLLNT